MPGGVCAILDYEVEVMADYVSEMATRIVLPRSVVNGAFRKFVAQILTSTRLPSTTILLGMNYLAKRVNVMHAAGKTNHTEGQIWRMITIALLLGSKFLDDNTFQNKSWSEVSGIPVQELNTLEYEWLSEISWGLYVNLDESKDYNAWLANWKEWLDTKQRQQVQASRERLVSIAQPSEADISRPRNSQPFSAWHQQQVAEYERLTSMKRNQVPAAPSYRRGEQNSWGYQMPWSQSAPLTPPDSGYGTPEYSNSSATSANAHYTEWFDRAIVGNNNAPRHYQQPAAYNAFHHAGHQSRNPYGAFYNYSHNIWEHPSVADCTCPNCAAAHTKPSYFAGPVYGQPVVG
ncbi:hypothetical protein B0H63DRAFT_123033 [Podospora didyma]|uniref:Cyclin n=1 Tax=Podospora didyma TaxID=330526 RepID=A0AAE0P0G6_9PEZI|nr:hypothetical protein B0H63DRAFT_123033 [Podospora didyma]